MLGFMDYVQNAFYEASHWNRDNSYGTLTATSRNILDFQTPDGIRLHVSSLASPNFATSYTLGSVGLVDGSLSYLYSSLPLTTYASKSSAIDLHRVVPGYRQLQDLRQPDQPRWWEIWHQGKRVDRREALLYGRLFLPRSTLEALYLRRLTPKAQLRISCVSDSRLPNGGTVLAHLQYDAAKHNTEYIYSTDSALLGVRGLYNFGPEPPLVDQPFEQSPDPTISAANEAAALATPRAPVRSNGRFSAGGEIYYGLLNKSGGISTGLRFTTLPVHTGFPYTMTLTLNPLMGNLSSTYSVLASPLLALSSRFDFNVYSYESELQVGTELWRRRSRPVPDDLDWARRKIGLPLLDQSLVKVDDADDMAGCLKARLDQRGSLGLLWEGRVKELLYSCGLTLDLKSGQNMSLTSQLLESTKDGGQGRLGHHHCAMMGGIIHEDEIYNTRYTNVDHFGPYNWTSQGSRRPISFDLDSMGIPPQPWQLKTFENKYTPYFRPTHALPVPGFYATPTLTNTEAFPPERRPPSVSGRLQLATDNRKVDYHKKRTPGMGTATKVLEAWSELYRPKQPIKPIYLADPPSVLSPSQKRRWKIAYAKLTKEEDDDKDPKHLRAYGELGKLQKLADLMDRPSPPASSDVWLRLGVGV